MENVNVVPDAYGGISHYIFVSYAHKDSSRVLPILSAMMKNGFRVWYDAGIEAGTEWPDYIAERLEHAAAFVAFLSPDSLSSPNCRQEINYAIDLGIPMLTIYLDEITLTGGMRMRLGLTQAMFYYRHATLDSFIHELTKAQILAPCLGTDFSNSDAVAFSRQKPLYNIADFVIEHGVLKKYVGEEVDTLVIPDGVVAIGDEAVTGRFTSVVIPNSVKRIGEYAFGYCTNLESVTIPDGVTHIGKRAFYSCSNLASVTIPQSVTHMGTRVFADCTKLVAILCEAESRPAEWDDMWNYPVRTVVWGCKNKK